MTDQDKPPISRFDFVTFSENAQQLNATLTGCAKLVENEINKMPNGREKALALTALEESVMWARKGLRYVE
jgi:hypothetical protein